MALSRRCKSSFRKDGHIHFEELIICHIEKRVWGYSVVNRGQYLASSEILKCSSSPTYRAYPLVFKSAIIRWSIRIFATLRRVLVFQPIGPKRQPYGGDFHFAQQRLNPGNNSLREIPIKETVAPPSEQFYLTTELSNVVGISHIFVTSFGRYPCRRWQLIFVRKILRPPITELFFCTKIPFWYAHDSSAALEYRLSV